MGIFRRLRGGRPEAISPSTGHAGDDTLLAHISAASDLEVPRHWVHYLYFKDEDQARSAAGVISSAGWQIANVDVAANGGPEWVVIAEAHAATTPLAVRDARLFFEGVATTHAGGEYDGWEAST